MCVREGWFGTGCRNAALVSTILARKKETLFSDIIKAVAGGFWHAERRIEEINDTPDSIHLTERRPVRGDGTKPLVSLFLRDFLLVYNLWAPFFLLKVEQFADDTRSSGARGSEKALKLVWSKLN